MARAATLTRGRPAIATAAVIGLEFAWLYTLLHNISEGLHLDVLVLPLLGLYALSFLLVLGLRATCLSSRATTLLSWTAWPLVTFLSLLAMLHGLDGIAGAAWETVFVVLAAAALWYLGALLARTRVTYETVMARFQIGLMMLVISLVVGYAVKVDQTAQVAIAVVFVGLGLAAAAVARTDGSSPRSRLARRGGTWWSMLLISLAVIVLLGFVASLIFTPGFVHLILRGFRGLWNLVERAAAGFANLFPSSCSESDSTQVSIPADPLAGDGGRSGYPMVPPSWLSSHIGGVIFISLLLGTLVFMITWRTISGLLERMRRGDADRPEMESLRGAFRLDLTKLFRRMLAWLSNLPLLRLLRRTRRDEPAPTTSMRRLYAEMLRWGAASGLPRGPSQTPFEYEQVLCAALPAHGTDVAFITGSYVRARYAAQPPTEAELHQLRESRRRLKGKGS
jgi:hypothetical protein